MTLRFALIVAMLLSGPALAAAPFDGRWAADPAGCAGEARLSGPATLTVSGLSLTWPEGACTVGTSYLLRDVWHVSARCWGEGPFISTVPIRLQVQGDRLTLQWGRARPEELRRCP
jgi:hypothetical protein